jgi:hypothetical protein
VSEKERLINFIGEQKENFENIILSIGGNGHFFLFMKGCNR